MKWEVHPTFADGSARARSGPRGSGVLGRRFGRSRQNPVSDTVLQYDRSTSVWVVVRVDLFQLRDGIPEDPRTFVAVKEVVDSEEQAEAEVTRLNELNRGKDVAYFYER